MTKDRSSGQRCYPLAASCSVTLDLVAYAAAIGGFYAKQARFLPSLKLYHAGGCFVVSFEDNEATICTGSDPKSDRLLGSHVFQRKAICAKPFKQTSRTEKNSEFTLLQDNL